jgi:hypothetical protein
MATQGLITVLDSVSCEVIAKIITGCDGYKIHDLVKIVTKDEWIEPNCDNLYEQAINIGLGCESCLVVFTRTGICYKGEDELSILYWEKFNIPQFNPRWKQGTVYFFKVIFI